MTEKGPPVTTVVRQRCTNKPLYNTLLKDKTLDVFILESSADDIR